MSLDIWTRCEGPSRVGPLALTPWRVVEAQHRVSTRWLVDTLEEQALLEEIVDEVKPPRPPDRRFDELHFLLFTPFRYPPLKHGSRFGTAHEPALWYGARELETGLAEKAYYQLVFVAGTTAVLENLNCLWSAFRAKIATARGVDLTAAPFARFETAISSPTSYAATQALGAGMRAAGVEACLFRSARCPKHGTAVALFQPAFASPHPLGAAQTWRCVVTAAGCEVSQTNLGDPQVLVFSRAQFEVGGRLPAPGLTD
ncbi:MAG TPA: RES family NAD+ phosphorylase [Polyangia bacterium]|nr:RES family NAD+ phosphorylase [Polyangia bacterium]